MAQPQFKVSTGFSKALYIHSLRQRIWNSAAKIWDNTNVIKSELPETLLVDKSTLLIHLPQIKHSSHDRPMFALVTGLPDAASGVYSPVSPAYTPRPAYSTPRRIVTDILMMLEYDQVDALTRCNPHNVVMGFWYDPTGGKTIIRPQLSLSTDKFQWDQDIFVISFDAFKDGVDKYLSAILLKLGVSVQTGSAKSVQDIINADPAYQKPVNDLKTKVQSTRLVSVLELPP